MQALIGPKSSTKLVFSEASVSRSFRIKAKRTDPMQVVPWYVIRGSRSCGVISILLHRKHDQPVTGRV